MDTLMLRLAAPLQAWGVDSKFEIRKTNREPTKSGVIGLLAAALGARRDDEEILQKLNTLRFGVRIDQEGRLLIDLHTARKDEKTSYLTRRHYLADAIFVVGLESEDRAFLQELKEALSHPAFPLYLGRRSCPPTQPVCLGIREEGLIEALKNEAWQGKKRRLQEAKTLRVIIDATPGDKGAAPQRDLAISFNPTHRQYGYRAVREKILEPKKIFGGETEHDPFLELR